MLCLLSPSLLVMKLSRLHEVMAGYKNDNDGLTTLWRLVQW